MSLFTHAFPSRKREAWQRGNAVVKRFFAFQVRALIDKANTPSLGGTHNEMR